MLSEDDHFYGLNDTRISVEGQFKSCALHLSCAFCSIIHRADSGRRVFHLASFSPWPSDLTELSAIREDPPTDLSPYSKGRRMIGKGWYTTLGFVCAAPHPVSISKGREVEEGDNALVPPIFPISSTYSTIQWRTRQMYLYSECNPQRWSSSLQMHHLRVKRHPLWLHDIWRKQIITKEKWME